MTRDLNVLFEAVGERIESVSALRRLERDYVLTLSPGARYAINLPDTQIVIGAGAPIAFARNERPSYGAILYLSVESKLFQ